MSPALGRPRGPSKGLLEGRRPRGWGNRAAMPGSRPRSRSAACTRPSPVPLLPPLPPPPGESASPLRPRRAAPASSPAHSLPAAGASHSESHASELSVLRAPASPPAAGAAAGAPMETTAPPGPAPPALAPLATSTLRQILSLTCKCHAITINGSVRRPASPVARWALRFSPGRQRGAFRGPLRERVLSPSRGRGG